MFIFGFGLNIINIFKQWFLQQLVTQLNQLLTNVIIFWIQIATHEQWSLHNVNKFIIKLYTYNYKLSLSVAWHNITLHFLHVAKQKTICSHINNTLNVTCLNILFCKKEK